MLAALFMGGTCHYVQGLARRQSFGHRAIDRIDDRRVHNAGRKALCIRETLGQILLWLLNPKPLRRFIF